MKNNPWQVTSFVFILVSVILLVLILNPGISGNAISEGDIGVKALDFINTNLLQTPATLDSVTAKNGLYEVIVNINGKKAPVYFTKDGSYIVQGSGLITLSGNVVDTTDDTQTNTEVPKSDKPKVELFVMTYCPYGTQAEKAIIPAIKALGNKIDATIRFVHYFMHGDKEEQETYTQLCIREENKDKYLDYLSCFLEDGNSARCLTKFSLNVNDCVANRAKGYYEADKTLSENYGVQGSPTLIVNGVEASFDRSPAGALDAICSAFNTAPSECNNELSTSAESPGFGSSAATDNSGGSCG